MLKRVQPRGISGGGIAARAHSPPEIARAVRSQFRPPHKGEVILCEMFTTQGHPPPPPRKRGPPCMLKTPTQRKL